MLTPNRLVSLMPVIKAAVADSVAPYTDKPDAVSDRLFNYVLARKLIPFEIVRGKQFWGLMTVGVAEDAILDTRAANIYSFWWAGGLPEEEIVAAFQSLVEWAKAQGCSHITADAQHPVVISILKKLGFDLTWVHGSLEV